MPSILCRLTSMPAVAPQMTRSCVLEDVIADLLALELARAPLAVARIEQERERHLEDLGHLVAGRARARTAA